MFSNVITKTVKLQDGREITIETGKLARQADGAVVVKMGGTMLLATVVSNKEAKEGVDFLPLSVDYQEKFASAGRIPGGFLKREGRLSDHEVLVCRLVDRVLRPLFPADYHADTQVNISLISADTNSLPDALAALAASAALSVSDIPFGGPIAEVRVAKVDDEYVINPTLEQQGKATIDFMVGASEDNIMMVEGESKEISEEDMLGALEKAHSAIKDLCAIQKELEKETGKVEKREYSHEVNDEELQKEIHDKLYDKVYDVIKQQITSKHDRKEAINAVLDEWKEALPEDHEHEEFLIKKYFGEVEKKAARNFVLNESKRLDGRETRQVRQIACEVDFLPNAHGSAVFTRGETQSLTTVTLGSKLDEQMVDGALLTGSNKFLLHYNFPGFSTGEVRPNRGPGRREIGHGNLALRALKPIIPTGDDNPYTIRVVSDILESNGSSSMATVCAGSLALMDSGMPVSGAVSGIAMGMISDAETGKYAILSDILGDEDHLGDMDFKVAGTAKGITACQMDIKIDGLKFEVLKEALMQAKEGREHILAEMNKVMDKPREDYKPFAPRYEVIRIEKDSIGAVIGPGGKVVQDIQKRTNTTVVIEEEEHQGVVKVFAVSKDEMDQAVNMIKRIVAVPEVGETYNGIVKSITPYGAFVEIMPGKEGLLHISEIKWERIPSMEGVLEVGEEIPVKLLDVDKKSGKFKLSRKALLPKPEK